MKWKQLLLDVQENAVFLLTCLGIFAALFLLALAAERLLGKDRRKLSGAKTVSFVAVFGAIASVLMLFEIPLFFAPSFYQLDLSEIPVLICGFYLGPVAGVCCELVKILLKLLLKGTSTAFVGDFANFAIGCALVLPATAIYHIKKSKKSAIIGLIVGSAVMTVFGSAFNAIYLLPKFSQLYGLPLDAIIEMGTAVNGAIHNVTTLVLFAVVPFNILKGIVVSVVTLLLYKRVERLLRTS
jgi:riboflavin transporter FmnP